MRPYVTQWTLQCLKKLKLHDLWPTWSPHLNLIEHVWDRLGRRIHARTPTCKFSQCVKNCLARSMRSETAKRDPYLIDSIPNRLQAVIWNHEAIFNSFHYRTINLDQFGIYTKYAIFYIQEIFFFVSSMYECFHNTCVDRGMTKKYYYPNYKLYVGTTSVVIEGESWV